MQHMKFRAGEGTNEGQFYHKEVVVNGISKALVLPYRKGAIAVSVSPDTDNEGSTLVEYSISPLVDIRSGSAIWHRWPHGEVNEPFVDGLEAPVTAVRFVSEGSSVCEVTA